MKLVAHKGGKGNFVQNTLKAFESAKELGYKYVECDIQVSKDDVFFVCHDSETKEYLFKETGKVFAEMPFSEIKKLTMYEGEFHDKITPLRDLLAFVRNNSLELIIEVKENEKMNEKNFSLIETLVELVKNSKAEVQILSKIKNALLKAQTLEMKTVLLIHKEDDIDKEIMWCIETKTSCDVEWQSRLTKKHVGVMHNHNLDVNMWTVDDIKEMSRLLKLLPDFITSNVIKPSDIEEDEDLKELSEALTRTGEVFGYRSFFPVLRNMLIGVVILALGLTLYFLKLEKLKNFQTFYYALMGIGALVVASSFRHLTGPYKALSYDREYLYIHHFTSVQALKFTDITTCDVSSLKREGTAGEIGTLEIKVRGVSKVYKITLVKQISKVAKKISEMRYLKNV